MHLGVNVFCLVHGISDYLLTGLHYYCHNEAWVVLGRIVLTFSVVVKIILLLLLLDNI